MAIRENFDNRDNIDSTIGSLSNFPNELRNAVISRQQETPNASLWAEKIRLWQKDLED